MKMERLVKRHVASVATGIFHNETARNVIVGASRAIDPNPQVDTTPVQFTHRKKSFAGGFLQDRKNLMRDRMYGEGRVFGTQAIPKAYGKTSRYA